LSSRWPDAGKYRNQDAQGKDAFSGISAEAAKVIGLAQVSGIGCDTMSVDTEHRRILRYTISFWGGL